MHGYILSVPFPDHIHSMLAAAQIDLGPIVAVVLALLAGVGGTLGATARTRDKAATVWRDIADAYKAEGEVKDARIAKLEAEYQIMRGAFLKDLSQEIGAVVGHVVAEELRRERRDYPRT